jgi:hypothetical protein
MVPPSNSGTSGHVLETRGHTILKRPVDSAAGNADNSLSDAGQRVDFIAPTIAATPNPLPQP